MVVQLIRHIPVQLKLWLWGKIPWPTELAVATSIGMPMPLYGCPHYFNSLGHGIGIGHTDWHAECHVNAIPLVSTLLKTRNDSLMQSIIHVPVGLELVAWGTIPWATASASATPIGLPSGVPMLFHQSLHYSQW